MGSIEPLTNRLIRTVEFLQCSVHSYMHAHMRTYIAIQTILNMTMHSSVHIYVPACTQPRIAIEQNCSITSCTSTCLHSYAEKSTQGFGVSVAVRRSAASCSAYTAHLPTPGRGAAPRIAADRGHFRFGVDNTAPDHASHPHPPRRSASTSARPPRRRFQPGFQPGFQRQKCRSRCTVAAL